MHRDRVRWATVCGESVRKLKIHESLSQVLSLEPVLIFPWEFPSFNEYFFRGWSHYFEYGNWVACKVIGAKDKRT